MVTQNSMHLHSVDFGNTKQAGCVPEWLAPSAEPVYLEGRLVLSLSFQGSATCESTDILKYEPLLAAYQIWDGVSETHYKHDVIELYRFEDIDIVFRDETPVWKGTLDTERRIIKVPDLDAAGFFENQKSDLYWKMVYPGMD